MGVCAYHAKHAIFQIVDLGREYKVKKILECIIKQEIEDNKAEYSIVTIVKAKGSTPRKVGTMMLVGAKGILEGTIGGGILEHQCMQKAQKLTLEESGSVESYILDNTKAESLGMICGGSTDVLFTIVTNEVQKVAEQALEWIKNYKSGYWCLSLVNNEISIERHEIEDCICIPFISERRIFLIGGGHVAMEVGRLLDYLGFHYVMVDDREEFTTKERFPGAEVRMVSAFEELTQCVKNHHLLPITDKDGFCILTRGHLGDVEALRFALNTQASYLGVMGSLRKRELAIGMLEKEGFQEVRDRVITPIGLDIGAQTPEELAISIVSQLIEWRAERK